MARVVIKTPRQWTKFTSCASYSGGKVSECHDISWSPWPIAILNQKQLGINLLDSTIDK